MKNLLKFLAKSVLIPLRLTSAASVTDSDFHKKMIGSSVKTLIVSIEQINNIITIVNSLEKSGLLIKNVSGTIKNEIKEEKRGSPRM